MPKSDDRSFALGLLLVLSGVLGALVGGLLSARFQLLEAWTLELAAQIRRLLATPEAVFEAQAAALGLFLFVAGVMLIVSGFVVIRYARKSVGAELVEAELVGRGDARPAELSRPSV